MKPKIVELPHGASIDQEENIVSFPLGSITLNLTFEEWQEFADAVDDVNTVLQSNTVESVMQCPTCNTIASYISYEEPSEKDVN